MQLGLEPRSKMYPGNDFSEKDTNTQFVYLYTMDEGYQLGSLIYPSITKFGSHCSHLLVTVLDQLKMRLFCSTLSWKKALLWY